MFSRPCFRPYLVKVAPFSGPKVRTTHVCDAPSVLAARLAGVCIPPACVHRPASGPDPILSGAARWVDSRLGEIRTAHAATRRHSAHAAVPHSSHTTLEHALAHCTAHPAHVLSRCASRAVCTRWAPRTADDLSNCSRRARLKTCLLRRPRSWSTSSGHRGCTRGSTRRPRTTGQSSR